MTNQPKTRRNYFIDPDMLEMMREYMRETGITEAELVRRAIERELKRVNFWRE